MSNLFLVENMEYFSNWVNRTIIANKMTLNKICREKYQMKSILLIESLTHVIQ